MSKDFIMAAIPTKEYVKRYIESENWETIQALNDAFKEQTGEHILVTDLDAISGHIENSTEVYISLMLILDPRGIGTAISVAEIDQITKKLYEANDENSFTVIFTSSFPSIDINIKYILELAKNVIFFSNDDFEASKHFLNEKQATLVIAAPSSFEATHVYIESHEPNILVNGDVLELEAIDNLCRLASSLKLAQSNQEIICYIEVPFKRNITALSLLLKNIYPEITIHLDRKIAADPNLSARELVAWFEDQDDTIIGAASLPIELFFNKQYLIEGVIPKCTYAYDPIHTEVSIAGCRINGLRAKGLLVLAGDPETAAKQILEYEANPIKITQDSKNQFLEYSSKHSNERICDAIFDLMECSVDSVIEEEEEEKPDLTLEQYPNVNPRFWYDEEYLWQVILAKAASINLHLADEDNGGLILLHDGPPFVKNDVNMIISKPIQIGGQEVAINLQLERFKNAIKTRAHENRTVIFIPLFKMSMQHWCLALINLNGLSCDLTIIETIKNSTHDDFSKLIQNAVPTYITVAKSRTITPRYQSDGSSCGPLTVKHIFDLIDSNAMDTNSRPYHESEIFSLRKEHLGLLEDEVLIERQKINIRPAKEPAGPVIQFDLQAARQQLQDLSSKLQDSPDEKNQLLALSKEFLRGELFDATGSADSKSKIKSWFASNAEQLDCVKLFDLFFEYKQSDITKTEPLWKDGGVDNLVMLLRTFAVIRQQPSKLIKFSGNPTPQLQDVDIKDQDQKQQQRSRADLAL